MSGEERLHALAMVHHGLTVSVICAGLLALIVWWWLNEQTPYR